MNHKSPFKDAWFTVPIAMLLVTAAGSGLLIKGLYRDVPDMVAQAKGQDLFSLVVVLPTLLITAVLARRGSLQARLIWLGGLVYLVYTYASFAFAIQYNPLFLVYIALLGGSLYALIVNLMRLDMAEVKALSTDKTPVKAASLYLVALAIFFNFLWLSELIPALLAGKIPQSILDSGTPTNVVYVLDLAWILPAFGITAVRLWRKHPSGYTLAGVLLSFFVLLVSAILSMAIFQVWQGNPGAIPQIVIFGILLATAIGMLAWYLRSFRLPSGERNEAAISEPVSLQMNF